MKGFRVFLTGGRSTSSRPRLRWAGWTAICLLTTGLGLAQYGRYRNMPPREELPAWELDKDFPDDVFTFARVQYSSYSGWGWDTDYPDAEANFGFRLQQMTSLRVSPVNKVLRLTDPRLVEYPFIYVVEPGRLYFEEEEVHALRRYLLNGGFLMADDFWGQAEWENFRREIRRVFPNREPQELPLNHAVFHCVFDLSAKPQIPNIWSAVGGRPYGITWERSDAKEVHIKGIYDDNNRMMVIICHNTDLGDGWEREGENEWYFHEFAEKKAYPLGINILFYAMTH